MKWLKRILKLHSWSYRNPFDRTCKVCGRHEVHHTDEPVLSKRHGWWEVFDEGDVTMKPCGEEPA